LTALAIFKSLISNYSYYATMCSVAMLQLLVMTALAGRHDLYCALHLCIHQPMTDLWPSAKRRADATAPRIGA